MDRRDSPMYTHDWNQAASTTPQYRSPEAVSLNIRQRIQDATVEQSRLARSREGVLLKRENVQTLNKSVQTKRMEAGDAEATFMNHIRNIINKEEPDRSVSHSSSISIVELYNRVESTRNDLGVLETDLQQAERALAGAELRFGEEEQAFYQYDLMELLERELQSLGRINSQVASAPKGPYSMPPPPPPPPPPPSVPYSIPPVHLDGQVYYLVSPPPLPPPPPQSQFVLGPRPTSATIHTPWLPLLSLNQPEGLQQSVKDSQANKIEFDGLGKQFEVDCPTKIGPVLATEIARDPLDGLFTPKPGTPLSFSTNTETYSHVISSALNSEAETEQTQAEDFESKLHISTTTRRDSEPIKYKDLQPENPHLLERSLSESAIFDADREPTLKYRVRAWLFTLLKENAIEKTLYQNILKETLQDHGFNYPDEESWEEPARQYWSRDSSSSFGIDSQTTSRVGPDFSNGALSAVGAEATTSGLLQRQSTRTNPATKTIGSRALYLDTSRDMEDQLDDPSDFPLPPSPISSRSKSIYSEDEMDDPCYFPLPRSPISKVSEFDRYSMNSEVKDQFCAPLPHTLSATEPMSVLQSNSKSTKMQTGITPYSLNMPGIAIAVPQEDELDTTYQGFVYL